MRELTVDATKTGMKTALDTFEKLLEEHRCPEKSKMEFSIAFEELFVNIVHYAYPDGGGIVRIEYSVLEEKDNSEKLYVKLTDSGTAYDPLAKRRSGHNAIGQGQNRWGVGNIYGKTVPG